MLTSKKSCARQAGTCVRMRCAGAPSDLPLHIGCSQKTWKTLTAKTFPPRCILTAATCAVRGSASRRLVSIVCTGYCLSQGRAVKPGPKLASPHLAPPSGWKGATGIDTICRTRSHLPSAFLTAGLVEPGAHAAGAGDTLPVLLEVRIRDDVVVFRHLGLHLALRRPRAAEKGCVP